MTGGDTCALCGSESLEPVFEWTAPPPGETPFPLPPDRPYRRRFDRCTACGLFQGSHDLVDASLYASGYVDATYGDRVREGYERILALPRARSDNEARVSRIVAKLGAMGAVLDVGSGLGVFPRRIADAGWEVTALDPDARAAEHLREHVRVNTICGDFMTVGPLGPFDLVTLNKVLEHVEEPVPMLSKAAASLAEDGVVYVEVPNGAAAALDGPEREEFFVEHRYAFDVGSLCLLAAKAGLDSRSIGEIREPSGKYTLFGFFPRRRLGRD